MDDEQDDFDQEWEDFLERFLQRRNRWKSGITNWEAEQHLRRLYMDRDDCYDPEEAAYYKRQIENSEAMYDEYVLPCHLCGHPTLFKDAAFYLPFCWDCLQGPWHRWYRDHVYGPREDG